MQSKFVQEMNKLIFTIIKDREQYDLYCDKLEHLTDNHWPQFDDEIELLSLPILK